MFVQKYEVFPLTFAIIFALIMNCWQIRINLWPDAVQKNLHFPLRPNLKKKKKKEI